MCASRCARVSETTECRIHNEWLRRTFPAEHTPGQAISSEVRPEPAPNFPLGHAEQSESALRPVRDPKRPELQLCAQATSSDSLFGTSPYFPNLQPVQLYCD